MKQFDTLVFIGRFQPLTNAHVEIFRRAIDMTRELIVVIGSSNLPRTYKNPWTFGERSSMINDVLNDVNPLDCRVVIETCQDNLYNDDAWAGQIQGIVSKYQILGGKTGIIGHKKDASSFYLDMFPQWETVKVGLIQPLNATDIREIYFKEDANLNFIKNVVPSTTYNMLEDWKGTPEWNQIIKERQFVIDCKKAYASLPYPPIFSTSDAVVVCSGHVLLIKRRAAPGKGLWACPGGYVNANSDKSVLDAAIRELVEETKIDVPVPVLKGSVKGSRVFDAVGRSPRGRIITHAFKIYIPLKDGKLPKVKGSDDADKAKWIPITEIKSEDMFEDHFDIVQWGIQ